MAGRDTCCASHLFCFGSTFPSTSLFRRVKPMRLTTRQTSIWTAAVILVLSGCGSGNKPMPKEFGPVYPVEGKVTLFGKPLGGGVVNFITLDRDRSQLQPFGVIDPQGRYYVSSYGQKGAPAGKYRVTIDPGSDDKQMDLAVDVWYTDPEKSPLIVEVKENAAPGAYDLKLANVKKR